MNTYQIIYRNGGSQAGWTTTARSEYEAIKKWEDAIKKGRDSYWVVEVKVR